MKQTEQFPPKDVQCKCGNVLTLDKQSDWCTKCVRKVFYHQKEQRRHQFNTIYLVVMALAIVFFLVYAFTEMVIIPMSYLK